jgi:hypothetical protein
VSNGAHDSGAGLGRSASANALRGMVVIAVAVLVGVVLLTQGLTDDEVETAAGPDGEAVTTTTVADDDEAPADGTDPADPVEPEVEPAEPATPPAVTPPAPRPPGEVRVLVLNGSGRQGEAGRGAQFFTQAGYDVAEPKNAPAPAPSAVYYVEGFEAEANAVAVALELDPALVVRPLDPAAPPIDDTQGANLLVMAGNDGLVQF